MNTEEGQVIDISSDEDMNSDEDSDEDTDYMEGQLIVPHNNPYTYISSIPTYDNSITINPSAGDITIYAGITNLGTNNITLGSMYTNFIKPTPQVFQIFEDVQIDNDGLTVCKKNKYYAPLISATPSQIVYDEDINDSYISIIPDCNSYRLVNLYFNVCNDICEIIDSYIVNQHHQLASGEVNGQIKKIRCEDSDYTHCIWGCIARDFGVNGNGYFHLCNEKIKLMWIKTQWILLYRRSL